ncbi:MAG: histone H1 [Phycisphaerales bacterium]|nr:histone H1 [Phycisphaerales bacterium]
MESFDKLKSMLAEIEEDLAKAEGGNKAAGVRVRKVMQDVKDAAQEIRVKILDMNKTEEKA